MWGHFANVKDAFGNAVNKVKEIANEIENQMDEAVGAECNYGDDIDIDGGYGVAAPTITSTVVDNSTRKNIDADTHSTSIIQSSSSSSLLPPKLKSSNLNNKKASTSSSNDRNWKLVAPRMNSRTIFIWSLLRIYISL